MGIDLKIFEDIKNPQYTDQEKLTAIHINHKECEPIMSFDQKAANENPWKAKIMYNRRVDVKEAEE